MNGAITWEAFGAALLAFIAVVGALFGVWRSIVSEVKSSHDSTGESIRRIHTRFDEFEQKIAHTYVRQDVYTADMRLVHQAMEEHTAIVTSLAQSPRCPVSEFDVEKARR